MVPPNLNFWSISRKESLESQQKHALWYSFLRIPLCSIDIFNPGYKWKMLIRKTTSILDGLSFNYEQLFHPVQCTAYDMSMTMRIWHYSSRDKLVLPKVTGNLSISDQLLYLWGINCFGSGTRRNSTCMYQSGNSHILFSYHYILSISGRIILLWNQIFQCLAIAAFQLQSE